MRPQRLAVLFYAFPLAAVLAASGCKKDQGSDGQAEPPSPPSKPFSGFKRSDLPPSERRPPEAPPAPPPLTAKLEGTEGEAARRAELARLKELEEAERRKKAVAPPPLVAGGPVPVTCAEEDGASGVRCTRTLEEEKAFLDQALAGEGDQFALVVHWSAEQKAAWKGDLAARAKGEAAKGVPFAERVDNLGLPGAVALYGNDKKEGNAWALILHQDFKADAGKEQFLAWVDGFLSKVKDGSAADILNWFHRGKLPDHSALSEDLKRTLAPCEEKARDVLPCIELSGKKDFLDLKFGGPGESVRFAAIVDWYPSSKEALEEKVVEAVRDSGVPFAQVQSIDPSGGKRFAFVHIYANIKNGDDWMSRIVILEDKKSSTSAEGGIEELKKQLSKEGKDRFLENYKTVLEMRKKGAAATR